MYALGRSNAIADKIEWDNRKGNREVQLRVLMQGGDKCGEGGPKRSVTLIYECGDWGIFNAKESVIEILRRLFASMKCSS
jgi:hypothetical protein